VERPAVAAPTIAANLGWAAPAALLALAFALFEIVRLWQSRHRDTGLAALVASRQYRLSTAALIMGLAGGAIFLLFGSAGYSSTFELVIEGALGTRPWPAAGRWLLLLAVLAGMLFSTLLRGGHAPDWRPRVSWLRNLAGGTLMGLGVALTPGGNDALVLYGVPTLSPHAIPAYAALAAGVVAGLVLMRRVFGIESRAVCKGDIFVSDAGLGTPTKR
jgi:hypothetical protein